MLVSPGRPLMDSSNLKTSELFTFSDGKQIVVPAFMGLDELSTSEKEHLASSYHGLRSIIEQCYGQDELLLPDSLLGNGLSANGKVISKKVSEDIVSMFPGASSSSSGTELRRLLYIHKTSWYHTIMNFNSRFNRVYEVRKGMTLLSSCAWKAGPEIGRIFGVFPDVMAHGLDHTLDRKKYLTAEEMTEVFKEVYKHAEKTLASVGVPSSGENIRGLIHLMTHKSNQHIKRALDSMPWLKTENRIDKNLALMIGMGFTYPKLVLFETINSFPLDKQMMEDMLESPLSWLIKSGYHA
jgi:hypothetical protein